MKRKTYLQLTVILGILVTPLVFQNCSPLHGEGSGNFSSKIFLGAGACDAILLQAWEPYRDALATTQLCVGCHAAGGPSGKPFAASDMDTSIQSMLDESENKIWSFALSDHRPGNTGPDKEGILAPHRDNYLQAETDYSTCLADQGKETPTDGLPTPTIKSTAVAIPEANAILDNAQTLNFTVNGYSVSLRVAAWDTGLSMGYDISQPTITANGQTLYVKNMGIYINDAMAPLPAGSAFQNVDRYIASGTTRSLFNSGVMNLTYNTAATNNIAVAFEVVQDDAGINFTPASYNQLVNGVFGNSCVGCHGAVNPDGGIDLSGGTYTINYLNGLFTPFDEESQILESVLLNRMPPAAPLSDNDKELVRGWILDGAPIN